MGDHERALQAFDVALVHAHDLAPALVARGHERLYRHEDDKALEDLDRAVRLYPTYPDAFGERCFARAVTGRDLEAAKADCETAIRLAPDSVEFIGTRALLEFKRGERDKALADLDAVLAKQPGAINALYLRGLVKRDLGDAPGAKADLDLALARHPQIAAEWAVFGVR
jgi:tetratricopeptide (TPR) repeat protein